MALTWPPLFGAERATAFLAQETDSRDSLCQAIVQVDAASHDGFVIDPHVRWLHVVKRRVNKERNFPAFSFHFTLLVGGHFYLNSFLQEYYFTYFGVW